MIEKTELNNVLVAIREQAATKERLAARIGKDIKSVDTIIKELKKEHLIFGSTKDGVVEYALTSKGLGFLIGTRRMLGK